MLVEAMERLGPCLSTSLTEHLINVHHMQPAAARQRVKRAPKEIKRLKLPFPRRAKFLYLEDDFQTPRFWKALTAAFNDVGKAYALALSAVEARIIIPLPHWPIVCGSPLKQKRHLSAETVLYKLKEAEALDILEMPGLGPCVVSRDYARRPEPMARAQTAARLQAERVLLGMTRDWVRRLAIASYDLVTVRDEPRGLDPQPRVSTFAWDMTGPSYLSALSSWNKPKQKMEPGFLACDVLLNEQITERGIAPFLHKCTTLQQLRGVAKTIHMFIAHGYTKEALLAARAAGIVPATPRSLFGEDVAEGFKQLAAVMTQAALGTMNPDQFEELFRRLGKVEGALGNLRGAFFEFIVAHIVRYTEIDGASVLLNKPFKGNDGKRAEADVFLPLDREPLVIECKGQNPGTELPISEVKKWLQERIPRVWEHLNRIALGSTPRPRFELWVTGKLSAEAIGLIATQKQAHAHLYDIDVVWSKRIREKVVQGTQFDDKFLQTLDQFFLSTVTEGVEDPLLDEHFPVRLATSLPSLWDEQPDHRQRRRKRPIFTRRGSSK
jgi:hypothetical protein